MSTDKVAQDVAQTPAMRHNPAPFTTAEEWEEWPGQWIVRADLARELETQLTETKAMNKTGAERLQFVLEENSRLRAQLITMSGEIEEQARLLGISGSEVAALRRPLLRLTSLWHQLFFLLDITEESDSGNEFRPNRISSCRAVDGERIQKILEEAKQLINAGVKN